ncbi:hypothetical protein LTR97_002746 [Elasticomyces elasticus]|uniref:LysM domain-containing protein n=1 Tax=Elasticomyces elasticus TaxID=574655 RepID=A0AAN8A3J3_9PEZI|nr:hypothetical protein LTR97_002746 [Elasticomyces elasticus]
MASSTACATCASSYDSPIDSISEKPLLPGRYLSCCTRSICARCLNQNKRYETYCPYCQISTTPSTLPQGLRDPPAYSSREDQGVPPPQSKPPIPGDEDDELPAYSQHQPVQPPAEKQEQDQERAPDVLHFLTPTDTLSSLALAYKVPLPALRKANNVFSDHLIQGRRTVIIPGEFYKGGVSLSPQPPEGEEEEMRRNKVRRWMVSCKVAEYDVALLYLQQAEWDLENAVEAYREDERWEKEHPLEAKAKGKKKVSGKMNGEASKTVGMRRFVGLGSGV